MSVQSVDILTLQPDPRNELQVPLRLNPLSILYRLQWRPLQLNNLPCRQHPPPTQITPKASLSQIRLLDYPHRYHIREKGRLLV
jgi:hypothetical protein